MMGITDYEKATEQVWHDVVEERTRQLKKWGIRRHSYPEWRAIFDEELAEFVCKVVAAKEDGYEELSHVVAVGIAWMIHIKLSRKEQKEEGK